MKYLFCGLGSIGERHLLNLLSLGENDIIAYRKKNAPLRTVKKKIKTYTNLQEALRQKPDVAFVTNPSLSHIPLAIELAKNGCHLLIEKPLSSNLDGVAQLLGIVKNKRLIVSLGFMMRYHPAMIQIKKWLEQNAIGFPICARVCWGEYLPAWHPWEDYSKSYSAKKELGGGPINTLCHDIDLASWFFDQPTSVFAFTGRKSSLKISTEHSVEILLKYKNKLSTAIHLDFLQLPAKRIWEIVGNKGRIEFDYYTNTLKLYLINQEELTFKRKTINYSDKFDRNRMFIDELKSFIATIKFGKKPDISLQDGVNNLKILIATHQSINKRRTVKLSEVLV